jgi:cytochrome c-type biogenesis protein CcmH
MPTLTFWIIAGALALISAAVLIRAVLRGADMGEVPAAYDLRVYRDQLREIDRDTARGIVAEDEAERLKSEVARRILAADTVLQAQKAGTSPTGPVRSMAIVAAGVVVAGTLALYAELGLKSRIATAEDMRQNRPAQAAAEARVPPLTLPQIDGSYADLMEKLRSTVAERPNDLQGNQLLARNEALLGNFIAAYTAQERILGLKGDAATATDYLDYADLLVLAAGGYVSPEAELALSAALARDPQNGAARYYVGLMMYQTGRPDKAFQFWDGLLREGPPDAPWIGPIRAQIEDAAWLAGQFRYELPPLVPLIGPDADDLAAAAEMTPEQRQEMVQGMVDQLAGRLAASGGTADEWARLISALGVLGDRDRARAILTEAREKFLAQPAALDQINTAARAAGVSE